MSIITTWDERARLDYEALTTEQKVVALERNLALVKEAYRAHVAELEAHIDAAKLSEVMRERVRAGLHNESEWI